MSGISAILFAALSAGKTKKEIDGFLDKEKEQKRKALLDEMELKKDVTFSEEFLQKMRQYTLSHNK